MIPGYWQYETSGLLRPAVERYLNGEPLGQFHLGILAGYLCRWIQAEGWGNGPEVEALRAQAATIRTREDIERWIDAALEIGIDPL
jgi:hypothetical protein